MAENAKTAPYLISSDSEQPNKEQKFHGGSMAVFEPTEEQRQIVKDLAGMGMPSRNIRTHIINPYTGKCISVESLVKYFKDDLDYGLSGANGTVLGILFDKCQRGDMQAITTWLNLYIRPSIERELELHYQHAEIQSDATAIIRGLVKEYAEKKEKEV